jgi:hypothetical protein
MADSEQKGGFISQAIDDIRHLLVEGAWFGKQTTGDISPPDTSSESSFPQREALEQDMESLHTDPATAPYADKAQEAALSHYDSMNPENNQSDSSQEQENEGYSFSISEMEQNLPTEAELENSQEQENELER